MSIISYSSTLLLRPVEGSLLSENVRKSKAFAQGKAVPVQSAVLEGNRTITKIALLMEKHPGQTYVSWSLATLSDDATVLHRALRAVKLGGGRLLLAESLLDTDDPCVWDLIQAAVLAGAYFKPSKTRITKPQKQRLSNLTLKTVWDARKAGKSYKAIKLILEADMIDPPNGTEWTTRSLSHAIKQAQTEFGKLKRKIGHD